MLRRVPAERSTARVRAVLWCLAAVTLFVAALAVPMGAARAQAVVAGPRQAPRPTPTPLPDDAFEGMVLPNVGPQVEAPPSQSGDPVAATAPSVGGVVVGGLPWAAVGGALALAAFGWLGVRARQGRHLRGKRR